MITNKKKKYELRMMIDIIDFNYMYLELRRNQMVKCSKMLCYTQMLGRRDTGDWCGGAQYIHVNVVYILYTGCPIKGDNKTRPKIKIA